MTAKAMPLHNSRSKTISVIIVSYMTGPALYESLGAVMRDEDISEVILVDNGNTDHARRGLSEFIARHDRIRLMQGHGNIGFSQGCNYGARQARGNYFLFLNPDAVISKGAALHLAKAGDALSTPWIAGGLLRDIHGREQRGSRRGVLTPLSAFISFTPLHRLPGLRSIHREHDPLPTDVTLTPTVSGACLMMDRASFEVLNGFDERYFLHVEDIDICHRVRQNGGDVVLVPSATTLHYGSTSMARAQDVEWLKLKGFLRYFWNYSPHWWGKVLTVLAAPFMAMALMGRVWFLVLRKAALGR